MSYRFVTNMEERILDHADHNVEEWRGYVNDLSDAPEYVTGDSSGLCCHDCRVIIVDTVPEPDDCLWGKETGRKFIYDDLNECLLPKPPKHHVWDRWTEYVDEDGEFTYVSEREGYALDAEEFGPIDGPEEER